MNRRNFFKNGSLLTLGTTLLYPFHGMANTIQYDIEDKNKKPHWRKCRALELLKGGIKRINPKSWV